MVDIPRNKKNAKHVFVFIQQTRRINLLTQNPYFADTFDINRDDSAKLATYKVQYGTDGLYPKIDIDESCKLWILNDLMEYSYRKNDYNTGVQLYQSNFETMYPYIYFGLRENKENITNEPRQLVFHYKMNEAANAQDYTIFAAILYEETRVIDQIGQELVVL